MRETDIETVVGQVVDRLFIELEASGRHVHLTEEQALTLFGHPLTEKRPLSQPGQYLAHERLTVIGPKGSFENVAVLGPARKEAQVEISLTDGKMLGITPPVRLSGSVAGTPGVKLKGPSGCLVLTQGVIVAQRHIHMTPLKAAQMGLQDGQTVKLQVYTHRPLIFDDVVVRVSEKFADYVHLDYDEANACGMKTGDLGRILP
jgi:propanediol utilization protein